MSAERRTNWYPPEKMHGGEDIAELYAMMLVDEVIGMMTIDSRSFELPIPLEMVKIMKLIRLVTRRLKQTGQFFYKDGGSVFADYNILRNEAYRKIGQEMGIDDPKQASLAGSHALALKFSPDMSIAEVLQLARDIVAQWNW